MCSSERRLFVLVLTLRMKRPALVYQSLLGSLCLFNLSRNPGPRRIKSFTVTVLQNEKSQTYRKTFINVLLNLYKYVAVSIKSSKENALISTVMQECLLSCL